MYSNAPLTAELIFFIKQANSRKMIVLEVGLNPGPSKHRLQSNGFILYAMTP